MARLRLGGKALKIGTRLLGLRLREARPLARTHSCDEFLASLARHMHFHPTLSEALLFSALRRKRLGVAFRRQQVIGHHIVDFLLIPTSPSQEQPRFSQTDIVEDLCTYAFNSAT